MKKLILSTLLLCALSAKTQTPVDTAVNTVKLEKAEKKKRRYKTWNKISLGIFVVGTICFFVKTSR